MPESYFGILRASKLKFEPNLAVQARKNNLQNFSELLLFVLNGGTLRRRQDGNRTDKTIPRSKDKRSCNPGTKGGMERLFFWISIINNYKGFCSMFNWNNKTSLMDALCRMNSLNIWYNVFHYLLLNFVDKQQHLCNGNIIDLFTNYSQIACVGELLGASHAKGTL